MKRRFFSLIEILVALTLFSFLMAALFFWHHRLTVQKSMLTKIERQVIEESLFVATLEKAFSRTSEPTYFFTEDDILYFVFDHGVDKVPLLSSQTLAALALDPDTSTVCMTFRPHPSKKKSEPSRSIPLLSDVTTLEFKFYFPPDRSKVVNPEKVGGKEPPCGWHHDWSKEYAVLPPLVEVIVTRFGKPQHYAFELPFSSQYVVSG